MQNEYPNGYEYSIDLVCFLMLPLLAGPLNVRRTYKFIVRENCYHHTKIT